VPKPVYDMPVPLQRLVSYAIQLIIKKSYFASCDTFSRPHHCNRMSSDELLAGLEQKWDKAVNHEFIKACIDGSVKPEQFNRWLVQVRRQIWAKLLLWTPGISSASTAAGSRSAAQQQHASSKS
jgi:hypothetical protein